MSARANAIALVVCLAAAGCGGAKIVPVSGRVTLDGQPLANAVVSFQPIAAEGDIYPGAGSIGRTDAEGRYTLTIVTEHANGAYIGTHRVEISAYKQDKPRGKNDHREHPINLVPAKYNSETTLQRTVEAKGAQQFDFELTSK